MLRPPARSRELAGAAKVEAMMLAALARGGRLPDRRRPGRKTETMDIKEIMSAIIDVETLEVSCGGHLLLERPLLNKGTAFTREERLSSGLWGLVPPAEETLDEQVSRALSAYQATESDLEWQIDPASFRTGTRLCFTGSCSTIWPR